MRRGGTLRKRVEARIAGKRDDVVLTREFRDLGGEAKCCARCAPLCAMVN
jgi:hypothetical protein